MRTGVSGTRPSVLAGFARKMAVGVICLGAVVLIAWGLDLPLLKTVLPGRPAMPPRVALAFVVLGISLYVLPPSPMGSPVGIHYRLGQLLGCLALLLGTVTLVQAAPGWGSNLHLDFLKDLPMSFAAVGSRPAFPTAVSLMALGLGLVLLDIRIHGVWPAEVLAVITLQTALLGIIGHLFGVPELYGSPDFKRSSGMSLHAAAGFLIMGGALLCARADHGLMALLRSHTPGGTLARRWLFMPGLLLLFMGFVYLSLQRTFGAGQAIASWALFMTSLTVLTAAVWATAEVLHQAGLEREAAHRSLEQRVTERTAELNEAYTALNATKEELARANRDLESTVRERTLHLDETIRSLETVCYNIAHDLRAPNRAIAGFAQVVMSQCAKSLDPMAMDCLRRIAKAAQRSDELTVDLLAYGRLGHADLPCSRQCLKTVARAAVEKLSSEISASGAQVEISEELADVWANAAVLEQVLTNLLTNALKFVSKGVRPHVTVTGEDAAPGLYRVKVQDNGIGIAPEHHARIFGVFQRLHSPDKYAGTGIGLAIVQKSVERMGGKAGVRSSPGEGSCFWFDLPKPKEPHEQTPGPNGG